MALSTCVRDLVVASGRRRFLVAVLPYILSGVALPNAVSSPHEQHRGFVEAAMHEDSEIALHLIQTYSFVTRRQTRAVIGVNSNGSLGATQASKATHVTKARHASVAVAIDTALADVAQAPRTSGQPNTSSSSDRWPGGQVAMACVVILAAESFLIHSLHTVSRNLDDLGGATTSTMTETLKIAWRGNAYVAMLAMLFLACRWSVLADPGQSGELPSGVRIAMQLVTAFVSLHYVWVAVLPHSVVIPEGGILSEMVGEANEVHSSVISLEFKNLALRMVMVCVQLVIVLSIIAGVAYIIVITLLNVGKDGAQMSVEFECVIGLVPLHISVQFFLWVLRMGYDGLGSSAFSCGSLWPQASLATQERRYRKAIAAVVGATEVSAKAPMIAALVLATKLRARQLEPPHGPTAFWAQHATVVIVVTVYMEALASAYIEARGEEHQVDGETRFAVASPAAHVTKGIISITNYIGLVALMVSIFTMHTLNGERDSLSPAVWGVVCLSYLYWIVRGLSLLGRVCFLMEAALGYEFGENLKAFHGCNSSASIGVSICAPMCALFLGCRFHALQITDQMGSPQGWAQDCMFICVVATCIQVLSCFALTLFTGSSARVDSDGYVLYEVLPISAAYAVALIKFLTLFTTQVAATAVICSIWLVTPENAMLGEGHSSVFYTLAHASGWVFVVVLLALVLSSAKVIGLAVKLAVERYGEDVLGIRVTADSATVCPWNGHVLVGNLVVHNHFGLLSTEERLARSEESDWKSPYLLKVNKLTFDFNIWRMIQTLGWEFEINRLILKGLDVKLEKAGSTTNVQMQIKSICQAYETFCGALWPGEDPWAPAEGIVEGQDYIFVHKVYIKDFAAEVISQKHSIKLAIEDLDCPDMYKRPMGAGDLLMFMMNTILKSVLSQRGVQHLGLARELGLAKAGCPTCTSTFVGVGKICGKHTPSENGTGSATSPALKT